MLENTRPSSTQAADGKQNQRDREYLPHFSMERVRGINVLKQGWHSLPLNLSELDQIKRQQPHPPCLVSSLLLVLTNMPHEMILYYSNARLRSQWNPSSTIPPYGECQSPAAASELSDSRPRR